MWRPSGLGSRGAAASVGPGGRLLSRRSAPLLADLDQLAVAADEVAICGVGGDPVAVAPPVVAAVTPIAVAPMAGMLEAAETAAVIPALVAEAAAMEALGRRRSRGE